MYKEHKVLEKPKDYEKIWRYMDFTKFLNLLDNSALFFSRVDQLGDPFEGSCPPEVLKYIDEKLDLSGDLETSKYFFDRINKCTAVNSWHLNKTESDAMWKIYLKSNEGIAIQSTFKRLKDSIRDKKHDIYIGKVKYIDYNNIPKPINPDDIFTYTYRYKRKVFQHEHELRAVIRKYPKTRFFPSRPLINIDGILVPVDLSILIDKIYIAPTSHKWQLELLKSVVSKYKLDKEVILSSIYNKPYENLKLSRR